MLYHHEAPDIAFVSGLEIRSMLSSPSSDDDPEWLINCRQAWEERRSYQPSDDDRRALSNIPHFDFELVSFSVSLRKVIDDVSHEGASVGNQNELMVLLEGLRWA
jgi:hypothetical protein